VTDSHTCLSWDPTLVRTRREPVRTRAELPLYSNVSRTDNLKTSLGKQFVCSSWIILLWILHSCHIPMLNWGAIDCNSFWPNCQILIPVQTLPLVSLGSLNLLTLLSYQRLDQLRTCVPVAMPCYIVTCHTMLRHNMSQCLPFYHVAYWVSSLKSVRFTQNFPLSQFMPSG